MNQKTMLATGMALAVLAIGAGAANRALEAKEREKRQAARAERAELEAEKAEPPKPLGDLRKVLLERKAVGELELRVTGERVAKLFAKDGRQVAAVKGYAGVREVPGTLLFGRQVVELAGKACRDPCNPTSVIVASPGGRPKVVVEAQGIVRFEDLDGDGTPEALVDHLVRHTAELVTLPFALEKEKFVPAYSKFPEKVDQQVEELGKAAERSCESALEGDCRDALLAMLAAHKFTGKDDLEALLSGLKVDPRLKGWARDEGLQRELGYEVKAVVQ